MIKDYSLTLSQRSALLDILIKCFKSKNLELDSNLAWEMTGRISYKVNQDFRELYNQRNATAIIKKAEILLRELQNA